MAEETPPRYCSICGQELQPEDQFCPKCGTPLIETAQVPTPEADKPVPVPPQLGAGAPGQPAQEQPAQRGWGRRHPILTGSLGIIGLFVILGILGAIVGGGSGEGNGGGGGKVAAKPKQEHKAAQQAQPENKEAKEKPEKKEEKPQAEKKPKPKPEYSVGQTAEVANVTWEVTDAFRTGQLENVFGTQKQGRFVVVDFTFTNNRNEEVTLDPQLHMVLKDSNGREFETDPDAYEFTPVDLDIFLEPVNPGVSTKGRVVYQVAPNADGFTLTLDDVEFTEDESAVFDFSNIPLQPYYSSSASATPTGPG